MVKYMKWYNINNGYLQGILCVPGTALTAINP